MLQDLREDPPLTRSTCLGTRLISCFSVRADQGINLGMAGFLAMALSASAGAEERGSVPGAKANQAAAVSVRAGAKIEGTLAGAEAKKVSLELSVGDYVRGRLDGARMQLTLQDREGKRIRVLVLEGGSRQEFMFVADDRIPYTLEVQAGAEGPYTLRIEDIVPQAEQVAPKQALESPRLRALERTLEAGGNTNAFWDEVRTNQGPLVEQADVVPPLEKGTSLVTFLWRGAKQGVRLFGAPSNDFDPMHRLGDSDVWYGSYRVPDDARIAYKLAPDVPELNASAMVRRRAILATAQRDPFNPKHFPDHELPDPYAGESLLELPGTKPSKWLEPSPKVAAGSVERHRVSSEILGNARDIYLYRPAEYRPEAGENALLVVFDASPYVDDIKLPRILDRLIAAGAIPPTAAVLVGNPSSESRAAELPPNPRFARFLAEELIPWAKRQKVSAPADRTVIAGASYGGLAAAYAGWMHPELFGNVYSQSGSFWWSQGSDDPDTEPEWLTRQLVESPPRPVRFYLEAGRFESGHRGTPGILETTRHLRDVLRARGYTVHHAEFSGAHGYAYWQYTFANGLIKLLGDSTAP